MALTDDSRALLQLLLGKGQSYADIADLLGVDEDEVRSRARAALSEISDRDPDANVPLTDYLLGQADPITRADVARHLADNPDDQELADTLTAQLRLLAPSASLPKGNRPGIAPARKPRRSSGSASSAGESDQGRVQPRLPFGLSQQWLIAILLGVALIVTIIILLITGVIGGGDDSNDSNSSSNPAPTTAILQPVKGESGKGNVEFGFSGSNLAANLQLDDLSPSSKDESYTTWLTGAHGIAYPINQRSVDKSGSISGQVTINQAIICFIAADAFTDIKVTRVQNDEMKAALKTATAANKGQGDFPKFNGKTVMEGPVNMPAAAKKEVLPTCDAATGGSTTAPAQ